MDANEIVEELEEEYETELSRLGSSKAIYAVTEGQMEPDAVLQSMADRALAAAETFSAWADDGGNGAEAFADAADEQRDHVDRITESVEYDPEPASAPLYEHLRGLDGPGERAGGLLAWALIEDRTFSQAVGFFVGNADPSTADLFRGLRSETEERRGTAGFLLEEIAHEDDADAALDAAREAIEAAYSHYVATLEGMGVTVKPVC